MSTTMTGFIDRDGLIPVPETDGEVDGLGLAIEEFACEHFEYAHDRNCHYDAVRGGGGPVQIKGAGWRVKNGLSRTGVQEYTQGRFRLYEADHEYLLEHDGWYAFVVYEWHEMGLIPLYAREMPADVVESFVLDGEWWDSAGTVPKQEGRDVRFPWTSVFPRGVTF